MSGEVALTPPTQVKDPSTLVARQLSPRPHEKPGGRYIREGVRGHSLPRAIVHASSLPDRVEYHCHAFKPLVRLPVTP